MMPGIGLNGGTFHIVSNANDITKHDFFDHNDDDENTERERSGPVARR